MAKFEFDVGGWVYDVEKEFRDAGKSTIPIMKAALYEGAKVLADAGKKAADAHGLGAGLGIATFRTDSDGIQTSIGFRDSGYFTNRWGQTVPYDLAANVLENGSSTVEATHFMSHAFKGVKEKAQSAMRAKFHEEMTKILGE